MRHLWNTSIYYNSKLNCITMSYILFLYKKYSNVNNSNSTRVVPNKVCLSYMCMHKFQIHCWEWFPFLRLVLVKQSNILKPVVAKTLFRKKEVNSFWNTQAKRLKFFFIFEITKPYEVSNPFSFSARYFIFPRLRENIK